MSRRSRSSRRSADRSSAQGKSRDQAPRSKSRAQPTPRPPKRRADILDYLIVTALVALLLIVVVGFILLRHGGA